MPDRPQRFVRAAGLCTLLLTGHGYAAAAPGAAVSPPSGDFLEFLGLLVERDGDWIDPMQLDGDDVLGRGPGDQNDAADPAPADTGAASAGSADAYIVRGAQR